MYVGEDVDHVADALHLTEVGGMHHQRFTVRTDRFLKMILLLFLELIEVNEIRNHINFIGDLERVICFFS